VRDVTLAWREARRGIAVFVGLCLVVLAWPTYFALLGPAHYSGPIWPAAHFASASLRTFLFAVPGTDYWWAPSAGRFARSTFIGLPILAALGFLLWRGPTRRRALVAVAAVAGALSLGAHYGFTPWHYVGRLGLLANVMNERFSAVIWVPLALAVAVVLEEAAEKVPTRRAIVSVALATALVAPLAVNFFTASPYTASRVWEPRWYAEAAPARDNHAVVLGFPFFNTSANLLSVQALHHMDYAVVGAQPRNGSRHARDRPGRDISSSRRSLHVSLAPWAFQPRPIARHCCSRCTTGARLTWSSR
jgi:hypothetical protein